MILENKTIITVAPTGSLTSREDNSNLPMEPAEIAEDVYECYKAGASICHLHMRGDDGQGEMRLDKFMETVRLIKAKPDCDIIINLTTSGSLYAPDETRMAPIKELKPEMASFVAGSINWHHNSLFINHPQFLEKLGLVMKECGTKPEIEIYDAGMIYNSMKYIETGVLDAPGYFQFIIGEPGGLAATVDNLVYLKNLLPANSVWSAVGVGESNLNIILATIALGGHVRVGLEDSISMAGLENCTNADMVRKAATIIEMAGKNVATPEEARKIIGIKRG